MVSGVSDKILNRNYPSPRRNRNQKVLDTKMLVMLLYYAIVCAVQLFKHGTALLTHTTSVF